MEVGVVGGVLVDTQGPPVSVTLDPATSQLKLFPHLPSGEIKEKNQLTLKQTAGRVRWKFPHLEFP